MGMKEVAEKYSDYQVEMRRWFHNNAEVSEKEYETAKKSEKSSIRWVLNGNTAVLRLRL